jgi:formylglycine-generating enzyme required for sulfatase activity
MIRKKISNISGAETRRTAVRKLTLRTPAEVYWRAFFEPGDLDDPNTQGLLAQGLHAENANKIGLGADDEPDPDNLGIRVQRMAAILGAMAFEMLDRKDNKKQPQPVFTSINVEPFLTDVEKRMMAAGQGKGFRRDYRLLLKMNNQILDYLFLDRADDRRIGFRDRPTQAFFAACWACCHETEPQLETTKGWLVDPLLERNMEFGEFWQFAAELPDLALPRVPGQEAKVVDERRWLTLFRPLYEGSVLDATGQPVRSTELIYRSWSRMSVSKRGQEIIDGYRAGFQSIRDGKQGEAPERLAREMLENLVPLGCNSFPGDTGSFIMGDPVDVKLDGYERFRPVNPQHEARLSPFRINRYCVTNREYELFDPRHRERRWGRPKHLGDGVKRWVEVSLHPRLASLDGSTDDLCPVVFVSWYDAWCFAQWTGNHLPTEAQWEYACRGGAPTYQKFHFGDTLSSHQANFDSEYMFCEAHQGVRQISTMAVGTYQPNAFGVYDMHGNVCEWCLDLYTALKHVIRGGSWGATEADSCRSAHRMGGGPGWHNLEIGFRLAAASELKPGQAKEESGA